MQTNTFSSNSSKISGMANKIIDKLMLTSGFIAVVWILAVLFVGMFSN